MNEHRRHRVHVSPLPPLSQPTRKEDYHAVPAPYVPGTYPFEVKRELATRLRNLYAEVMET